MTREILAASGQIYLFVPWLHKSIRTEKITIVFFTGYQISLCFLKPLKSLQNYHNISVKMFFFDFFYCAWITILLCLQNILGIIKKNVLFPAVLGETFCPGYLSVILAADYRIYIIPRYQHRPTDLSRNFYCYTVCPRSIDQFYAVSYYIKTDQDPLDILYAQEVLTSFMQQYAM